MATCTQCRMKRFVLVNHAANLPGGTEYVDGFGKAIVVEDPGINREEAHQEDDVTSTVKRTYHL